MAEIINLRQARKKRGRDDRRKSGDENAAPSADGALSWLSKERQDAAAESRTVHEQAVAAGVGRGDHGAEDLSTVAVRGPGHGGVPFS